MSKSKKKNKNREKDETEMFNKGKCAEPANKIESSWN